MYEIGVGAAQNVTLPSSPVEGDAIYYKNFGTANVTLIGPIEGAATRTLYVGEGLILVYVSGNKRWEIVAQRVSLNVTPS